MMQNRLFIFVFFIPTIFFGVPAKVTSAGNGEALKDTTVASDPALEKLLQSASRPGPPELGEETEKDHFPVRAEIEYAEGFTVEYHNNCKVVRVTRPRPEATRTFTYLLVRRGTPVPRGYSDAMVIRVPIERFVSMGSAYLASLGLLESLDTLVGVDKFGYVTSPTVWEMVERGEVAEVTPDERPDMGLLLDLSPDLVMTASVGGEWDFHDWMMELNLPVVINGEWVETHPLGRAEWMKFIALFLNKEEEAKELFEYIESEYLQLKSLAAGEAAQAELPKIFTGAPYQGTWGVPGGESYMARLIEDAGGDYLFSEREGTGSLQLPVEEVLKKAADADVWINAGWGWETFSDALETDERFAELKAFQTGKVYTNEKRVTAAGSNDYWETGVTVPSLILADLIRIFHPELLPDYEFSFYEKLTWE